MWGANYMRRKNLESHDSRADIKNAALEEFILKGKYGTRMEEIGRKAKINKAMVYYYYSTKEKLYKEILEESISKFYSRAGGAVENVLANETDEIKTLRELIAIYLDTVAGHGKYMKLIFDALANEPEEISSILNNFKEKEHFSAPAKIIIFLEKGMKKGLFRKTDPQQLMISIISVCFFYFFAKPILNVMLSFDVKDEQKFGIERKEYAIEFLMSGILK